jgi:PAS domain S-box-containing protein
MIIMGSDITNCTRAEEALAAEDSKAKYERVVSMISDIVWSYDVNSIGEHIGSYISPVADRLLSLPDGTIGNSFDKYFSYVHPDDLPGVQEILFEVIRTLGKDVTAEYRLLKADGTTLWVRSKGSAYSQADGQVTVFGTTSDITERKRAEEALKATEERYRTLVENANEAIVVAQDGMLKFVNRITSEKTGYSKQELTSRPFPELIHPEDRDMVVQSYLRRFKGDVSQSRYPFRVVTKNGNVRWMEIDAVLIEWEGRPATLNFLSDITERKRAEDALKESKEHLNQIIDRIGDPLFVKDRQHRLVMVNDAACKLFGRFREEIIGRTANDLFPSKEMAQISWEKDEEVFRTGVENLNEETNAYAPGKIRTVQVKKTLYIDNAGNQFLVGITRDITERKQMEEALGKSQRILADIINFLPDATLVIDRQGKVIAWNRAIEVMTGVKAEDILGKGDYEYSIPFYGVRRPILIDLVLLPQEEVEKIYTSLKRQDGVLFGEAYMPNMRDGEVYLSGSAAVLYDDEGNVYGAIESIRDVTDRKRAEEQKQKAERELKEAHGELEQKVKERTAELEARNAEMERFIYTVSHELRSPLISTSGFVGIMKKDLEMGNANRIETDLRVIEGAVTKMDQLLTEILELSRIGRVVNPHVDVPFSEIVTEALDQIAEKLKSREVEVSMASDPPMVHVDRMRIVEVLVNLIENSIKYMGDQPWPRIEIGHRLDGDQTVFIVQDNGMGIDPSQHEKVFGLFYKVEGKNEGTGVGLALVKRIIEVHGGRIWIESELGKGCSVCFTLPLA